MTQYANTNIWTPPKTWNFEELVGATAMNQQVRDNMLFGPGLTRMVIDNTVNGNVGTGEDDLTTYSLPADTLDQDGMALLVLGLGQSANNANTKGVRAYFGSSMIALLALDTGSSASWACMAIVMRTGATAQLAYSFYEAHGTSFFGPGGMVTPAETLSSAVTIKFTGNAISDNDIQQKLLFVALLR